MKAPRLLESAKWRLRLVRQPSWAQPCSFGQGFCEMWGPLDGGTTFVEALPWQLGRAPLSLGWLQ